MKQNRKVDLRKMVESISLHVKLTELVRQSEDLHHIEGIFGTRLAYNGRPVHISVETMEIPELGIKFSSPKDAAWVPPMTSDKGQLPGVLIVEADPPPVFNPLGIKVDA